MESKELGDGELKNELERISRMDEREIAMLILIKRRIASNKEVTLTNKVLMNKTTIPELTIILKAIESIKLALLSNLKQLNPPQPKGE